MPFAIALCFSQSARLEATRQQPVFRAAVDLIAVDVQVVIRAVRPILALDREKFEVTD